MNVLYISYHSFHMNGGGIASSNLLRVIRGAAQGKILALVSQIPKNLDGFGGIEFIEAKQRSILAKTLDILKTGHYSRLPHAFKALLENISCLPDVVFIDGALLSPCVIIARKKGIPTITFHQNNEKEYMLEAKKGSLLVRIWGAWAGWQQLRCLTQSEYNLFITNEDMESLIQIKPSALGMKAFHFGHYESEKISDISLRAANKPYKIAITGNLSVSKGYIGVVDFFRDYFPKLINEYPFLQFVLAGKEPNPSIYESICGNDNVEVIPNPKEIQPIVEGADIYLNPCYLGSGIKIRNFDGLRNGLPVICHEGNSQGFSMLKEPFFFKYKNVEECLSKFEKCFMFIQEEAYRKKVIEVFHKEFSLEKGIIKMKEVLNKVLTR